MQPVIFYSSTNADTARKIIHDPAMGDVSKPRGEPIWAHDPPDLQLLDASLIRNRTASQCYNAFYSIPAHYGDVIMGTIASQITSLTTVYSTVYSDADQRKHQSSASLAFVWGIHRGPVNSQHKWPVTREMFPFDDWWRHQQIATCHLLSFYTIHRFIMRGV